MQNECAGKTLPVVAKTHTSWQKG